MAETVETKTPGAAGELVIHKVIKLGVERNTSFYRNTIFLSISLFYLDIASMIFFLEFSRLPYLTPDLFLLQLSSWSHHPHSMIAHMLGPP